MQIYPAIDLRNGKCVRLYQGNFAAETIYADDPLTAAANFVQQGATWLHIVDLDAAKNPDENQAALVARIAMQFKLNIQTGGGIRTTEQIKQLFDHGVSRVIVGSQAVKNPSQVLEWFKLFGGERLVLACDVQQAVDEQFYVVTHGWQNLTEYKLLDFIAHYDANGLIHLLCTDIGRDGTLQGPNMDLYKIITQCYPSLQLQASGGVRTLTDLQSLREQAIAGVIVGRALYENKFTLGEALSC